MNTHQNTNFMFLLGWYIDTKLQLYHNCECCPLSLFLGRSLSLSGLLFSIVRKLHYFHNGWLVLQNGLLVKIPTEHVSGLVPLICVNVRNLSELFCGNCVVGTSEHPGLINGLLQMTTTGKRWKIFEMFVMWGLSG